MLFNSHGFIFIFLPIALTGYFILGKNVRASNLWLLAASFFFYGWWDWRFVPLLFASIIWNYVFGLKIGSSPPHTHLKYKKILLVTSVSANIVLLGYFKYAVFFIATANRFAHMDWNELNIVLPLGISFWTFTQTAWLVDVYRGKNGRCSFWDYALFVMIFPHLISGPIINHAEMLPQFTDKTRHSVNWENMASGIMLFMFGLFKKVLIADSLAPIVTDVFSRTGLLPMMDAWIGVLAYTFQLYFDFSGYSEMAVGLGKMLNLDFPVNFDSPYKSTSPIEFWRRWHITLGGWIRDYLYIPLGGNRKGQLRKMLNLFICMTLCGFWHGAGFTFIIWGMLHGILLVINHTWRRFAKPRGIEFPKTLGLVLTFTCTAFSWIIFRSDSLTSSVRIARGLFNVADIAPIESSSFFARIPVFSALLLRLHVIRLSLTHVRSFTLVQALAILGVLVPVVFRAPNVTDLAKTRFKTNTGWLALTAAVTIVCFLFFSRNSVFLYFDF